ncbi:unnamed protein product [Effrenium voratum]|nr:unnamed protein product [Effrenium voratum]
MSRMPRMRVACAEEGWKPMETYSRHLGRQVFGWAIKDRPGRYLVVYETQGFVHQKRTAMRHLRGQRNVVPPPVKFWDQANPHEGSSFRDELGMKEALQKMLEELPRLVYPGQPLQLCHCGETPREMVRLYTEACSEVDLDEAWCKVLWVVQHITTHHLRDMAQNQFSGLAARWFADFLEETLRYSVNTGAYGFGRDDVVQLGRLAQEACRSFHS